MKIQAIFLLLALCFGLVMGATDPCSISFGGEDYDLSGANNSTSDYMAIDYPSPKFGSNVYYIQVCKNTMLNCSGSGNTATPICQKDTGGNFHSLGQLSTQSVTAATNSTFGPYAFQIAYGNGQNGRNSVILMKCNADIATGNVFTLVNEPVKPIYYIFFQSKFACAGAAPSSFGGGLVFVIIVLALLGVYFLGGMAYMKFARHAEGREIIPNHEFWFDLPSLIKDGCMFLVNKCRGRSGYSTVE